jgi:hypothetical protein
MLKPKKIKTNIQVLVGDEENEREGTEREKKFKN